MNDVLGLMPPTTAVIEVNAAMRSIRASLDEQLRAGGVPTATAMFGARAKLETQDPTHDVIFVNVESPARSVTRDKFAAHLREVAERCRAEWLLVMLPGRAVVAEFGEQRLVVMFVVEVRGRPTELYLAFVEPTDGAFAVSSFARVAVCAGFESFRYLLTAPSARNLN